MKSEPLSEDRIIRASRFAIHERPKGGPAVWARQGRLYLHDTALRVARREAVEREAKEELRAGP